MRTKYVLFAALGVAAVLLLTSDKAKELRDSLEDQAKENAKKWRKKLRKTTEETVDTIANLKTMLNDGIEGLSDDARQRIEDILEGSATAGKKVKKTVSKQLS